MCRTCRVRLATAALVTAIAAAAPSYAQGVDATETPADASPPAGAEIYDAAFFDQYAPQTAFDMIVQVPGFDLALGDDQRGFGGNAGNVLIDGRRPVSKAEESLQTALERVPARQVARIEVVRGELGAAEASGQTVVANVIRTPRQRSGVWSVTGVRRHRGALGLDGSVSLNQTLGRWSLDTSASGRLARSPEEIERAFRDAMGGVVQRETERSPFTVYSFDTATELTRDIGRGDVRVNANVSFESRDEFFDRLRFNEPFGDAPPQARSTITLETTDIVGDLSVEWSGPLATPWSWTALGLASFVRGREDSTSRTDEPFGRFAFLTVRDQPTDRFEAIARTTATRSGGAFAPELGVEAVFNRQEAGLDVFRDDGEGLADRTPAIADTVVAEVRNEAFANLTWRARPKLRLEGGLAVERSDISVRGDAVNRQSLSFLKPTVTATYTASDGVTLRADLTRDVSQLSFDDFAARADVENEQQFSGNPELRPERAWELSVGGVWRFTARGALDLEASYTRRSDVLEQTFLAGGGAGVANAADAREWGVRARAEIPTDAALGNGLVRFEGQWRDAVLDDPVTNFQREPSGVRGYEVSIGFRQDVVRRQVSWGFDVEIADDLVEYFVDEIRIVRPQPSWGAFVETTRLAGVKARLRLSNQREEDEERLFFAPDRRGEVTGSTIAPDERRIRAEFSLSSQF